MHTRQSRDRPTSRKQAHRNPDMYGVISYACLAIFKWKRTYSVTEFSLLHPTLLIRHYLYTSQPSPYSVCASERVLYEERLISACYRWNRLPTRLPTALWRMNQLKTSLLETWPRIVIKSRITKIWKGYTTEDYRNPCTMLACKLHMYPARLEFRRTSNRYKYFEIIFVSLRAAQH